MNRNARIAVLLSAACLTFNVSPSWGGGPPNPTPSDVDGNNALHDNTTGFNNSALGNNALAANTTGSNNIAVGWQALGAAHLRKQ